MAFKTISKEEFIKLHLLEDKSYSEISEKYNIDRKDLSEWWDIAKSLRLEIKKSNSLYNQRKKLPEFRDFLLLGKKGFYEWFTNQKRICHYCKIEENKLEVLFKSGTLTTKRKRGPVLELERRDSTINKYSPENCVLACYFCNNHKSDIISESDHVKYFAGPISKYLNDKYKERNS